MGRSQSLGSPRCCPSTEPSGRSCTARSLEALAGASRVPSTCSEPGTWGFSVWIFLCIPWVLRQVHQASAPGLDSWPQLSPARSGASSLCEAGVGPPLWAAGGPGWSFQPLQVRHCPCPLSGPSPLASQSPPSCSPLSASASRSPFPRAKGSEICVLLPCLTPFLSGSLVHLSSWFWGPTQRSLGDPGWHLSNL